MKNQAIEIVNDIHNSIKNGDKQQIQSFVNNIFNNENRFEHQNHKDVYMVVFGVEDYNNPLFIIHNQQVKGVHVFSEIFTDAPDDVDVEIFVKGLAKELIVFLD